MAGNSVFPSMPNSDDSLGLALYKTNAALEALEKLVTLDLTGNAGREEILKQLNISVGLIRQAQNFIRREQAENKS